MVISSCHGRSCTSKPSFCSQALLTEVMLLHMFFPLLYSTYEYIALRGQSIHPGLLLQQHTIEASAEAKLVGRSCHDLQCPGSACLKERPYFGRWRTMSVVRSSCGSISVDCPCPLAPARATECRLSCGIEKRYRCTQQLLDTLIVGEKTAVGRSMTRCSLI